MMFKNGESIMGISVDDQVKISQTLGIELYM
jgi:hypothetical protein